jgi:hypothetical protein
MLAAKPAKQKEGQRLLSLFPVGLDVPYDKSIALARRFDNFKR